jgi:hypothetical protein
MLSVIDLSVNCLAEMFLSWVIVNQTLKNCPVPAFVSSWKTFQTRKILRGCLIQSLPLLRDKLSPSDYLTERWMSYKFDSTELLWKSFCMFFSAIKLLLHTNFYHSQSFYAQYVINYQKSVRKDRKPEIAFGKSKYMKKCSICYAPEKYKLKLSLDSIVTHWMAKI